MDEQLFTVAVFSENQVGLLNQISIIFTRRCLNIESLSVSPSSIAVSYTHLDVYKRQLQYRGVFGDPHRHGRQAQ